MNIESSSEIAAGSSLHSPDASIASNMQRLAPVALWAALAAICPTPLVAAEKYYTQQPEIAPSQSPEALSSATQPTDRKLFEGEPKPTWIWGADQNKKYVLKTTFTGGSKSARLKAACDNVMTLYLNGQRLAASDAWESPIEIDVQKFIKDDENVLTAEVENQGGPAGFILSLALAMPDGNKKHVVTDGKWQAAGSKDSGKWVAANALVALGGGAWGDVFANRAETGGTPAGVFNAPPGFQVEKLFTVPKEELGSWVAITFDNKGRLIVSDQGDKGLCRVTPPAPGGTEPTKVERLNVKISSAQGLLYAFDSLYVSVNGGPGSGLYRVKDTNGDDQFDEVVKLKDFRGGGEHGPHALRLSPDGKSIYCIAGNHTRPPFEPDEAANPNHTSRIPTNWGEDLLLPRQWDANGHAVGILAPGGWIAKTDPDGKTWDVFSIGYRNPYDMAFNADGELFAYDADMEWDFGSPWYRPTRVVHATSGSEFGWRSGTGKWPPYYVDSLPPAVDIGPGSPVGIEFGYGTKFPPRYQRALFICDWTFGTMYAIHFEPDGASYRAIKEEFVSRTALPLTDVAAGPDGALYFTVGGRGTQSELFRVTYTGQESTSPIDARDNKLADLRALRAKIEMYHQGPTTSADAVEFLYPHLSHADRHIRYAARVALERAAAKLWQDKVLAEKNDEALITGAVGLARQPDKSLQPKLLAALDRIDFSRLSEMQQLELLRAYQLIFIRMGEPAEEARLKLIARLDPLFPAKEDPINRELSTLLVYLRSPNIIRKAIALLEQPSTHESPVTAELLARNRGYGGTIAAMIANFPDQMQIHYAFVLRNMKEGWTLDERKAYFSWFEKAHKWSGGASFQGFLRNIDREAFDNASEKEKLAIEAFGARKPYLPPPLPQPAGPGKDWTLADLLQIGKTELKGRNFDRGQKMFAAARCVICHRFAGDGGATGPDLTQLAGRFNLKDLSEAIVDPSKVVSDQYRASIVQTASGKTLTGRIVSETDDSLIIVTNPEDSTKTETVKKNNIEELQPSAVSLMPNDLLKPLNKEEVLDLLAYLLSRGNKNDRMFQK